VLIRYGDAEWEWGRWDWLVSCWRTEWDWFVGVLGVRLGVGVGAERRHQGKGAGVMLLLTSVGDPWRDVWISLW